MKYTNLLKMHIYFYYFVVSSFFCQLLVCLTNNLFAAQLIWQALTNLVEERREEKDKRGIVEREVYAISVKRKKSFHTSLFIYRMPTISEKNVFLPQKLC